MKVQAVKPATPVPLPKGVTLQRKCDCANHTPADGECEECKNRRPRLQRQTAEWGEGPEIPLIVREVLRAPGQPLDLASREFFEPSFGRDFSQIRVHTDANAAASARAVNASAYTAGTNLVFGEGRYAPQSAPGRRLIAHELAHAVQQEWGWASGTGTIGAAESLQEMEADRSAQAVTRGEAALAQPRSQVQIARKPAPAPPQSAEGPPFFGLETAPDAFHGIAFFYDVTILPYTDYIDLSMVMRQGPYLIAPNLRRNSNGTSSIGYYNAFRKEPGLIGPTNWNEYAIGPDSITQFLGEIDAHARAGATVYMFGPPAPNAIESGRFVNHLMAGELSAAGSAYGRALAESVKDPGWWVQMLTASAGLFRGPAGAARVPTPRTPLVSRAPFTAPARPTLTVVSRGGGAAIPPVGPVSGVAYAAEGNAAVAVGPTPAPVARPIPTPLRIVHSPAVAPTPIPIEPLIPPAVAVTVSAVVSASARSTLLTTAGAVGTIGAATTLSSDSPQEEQPQSCQGPTGLTPFDPIPITWFKVWRPDYYPTPIEIGGHYFDRDDPGQHLPRGEPIGVSPLFTPYVGKTMQLDPIERGPGADRYRAVLARYGFDWSGLQADHVQDLQWSGMDDFNNLWPMDRSANLSAGPRQNDHQAVTFCETRRGPSRTMSLRQMKSASALSSQFFGRWFVISSFQR